MREIIFRGKHVHALSCNEFLDGTWIYGYLTAENYISTKDFGGAEMLVDPETVGQYTGLTDKNGVKIFEGDILKWTDHQTKGRHVQGAVVMWAFGWKVKNIFNYDYENWSWSNNTHEVIGNIHDNPYLLEESK